MIGGFFTFVKRSLKYLIVILLILGLTLGRNAAAGVGHTVIVNIVDFLKILFTGHQNIHLPTIKK